MNTKLITLSILAGSVLAAMPAAGQRHTEHHGEAAEEETAPALVQQCAMMKQEMEQMHARMKEREAGMQALIEKMNASSGPAKVEFLAEIVTKMAQHRQEMHQMHTEMMQKMMSHMGEHMMQSDPDAGRNMMQCPMMQSMGEGHAQEARSGSEEEGGESH